MITKLRLRFFNKIISVLCLLAFASVVTSCGSQGVASFDVDITMEGGSGKAYIESPVTLTEEKGRMTAHLVWSSKNYDYMIVDGIRYDNETPGEQSSFTIPVESLDEPLNVIGDTTAMSEPHEIEYVIYWNSSAEEEITEEQIISSAAVADSYPDKLDGIGGLEYTGEKGLNYAECFFVAEYGKYRYIHIDNSGDYLLIPEDGEVPEGLPDGFTVLKKPLDKTYLVSTSVMDLIEQAGALDRVRMCALRADEWYIPEAKKAMDSGNILYAGKYRAPDYEMLLSEGCDLAIENTMIYHEPSVKEKLEELGIPVMIETSSYEPHPLGRLEWIRLYGVLFGLEDEADGFYETQLSYIEPVIEKEDTGVTVAFFHVTANGLINVRKPGDYISSMIDLSGGEYIIKTGSPDDNALSTMNIQMEDFYAQARDADILIYNSTIGGEISSMDELVSKDPLFADFKAVREGNVYCTGRELFQQVTGMADFMNDLNAVFTGTDRDLVYLHRLD